MNTQEHKCRIDSKFETSLDTQRQQKKLSHKKITKEQFYHGPIRFKHTYRKNEIWHKESKHRDETKRHNYNNMALNSLAINDTKANLDQDKAGTARSKVTNLIAQC